MSSNPGRPPAGGRNATEAAIRWPAAFEPSRSPVHVRNEIEIAASAGRVWAWLVRAERWPEWYANSRDVRFLAGRPPDLAPGTRFRWRTFGVRISSRVLEFEPPHRLAWDARGIGVLAYHAWLVQESPGGCRVLTEETQRGWLARLGARLMPARMWRGHQLWLESLRERAPAGAPDRVEPPGPIG